MHIVLPHWRNIVIKLKFDRTCFQRGEAGTNFGAIIITAFCRALARFQHRHSKEVMMWNRKGRACGVAGDERGGEVETGSVRIVEKITGGGGCWQICLPSNPSLPHPLAKL